MTDASDLDMLSQAYPTAEAVREEIDKLNASLLLPKPVEYFVSDPHGEYRAFSHVLRNGSGAVRKTIDNVLGMDLDEAGRRELATLVYYPQEKLPLLLDSQTDPDSWRLATMHRLVVVCKPLARRHTREQVEALVEPGCLEAIEKLLYEPGLDDAAWAADAPEKADALGTAHAPAASDALIESLCYLIQHLTVDHLHMVGDVYDRGPEPQSIMEMLMGFHSIDIQWGNHDIVWMGASLGQRGCIGHVVRNCARYGNMDILTSAYGMDLSLLEDFALKAYKDDPCVGFGLKVNPGLTPEELDLNVKIQKAMAILQFKAEAALIDEYPEFKLENRKLLHAIDRDSWTFDVDGTTYEVADHVFPTVDWDDPYALTPEEELVMQSLQDAFTGCDKLQRHIRFMLDNGSLYKICNGNLLLHACVPLNDDGSLKEVDVFGKTYKGKALYDVMQEWVYKAFRSTDPAERKRGEDMLWYLWLGQGSPLFAKDKMATFEIYLSKDKAATKENKNAFYKLFDQEAAYCGIFEDFGLDPKTARIINGHVPVKAKDGEDPVKAGGKVICIDGGFSIAYQPTTGIAGYTLISGPDDLVLASHEPLGPAEAVIGHNEDLSSTLRTIEQYDVPKTMADTDEGAQIRKKIAALEQLAG